MANLGLIDASQDFIFDFKRDPRNTQNILPKTLICEKCTISGSDESYACCLGWQTLQITSNNAPERLRIWSVYFLGMTSVPEKVSV
jgi:hypothetical protein